MLPIQGIEGDVHRVLVRGVVHPDMAAVACRRPRRVAGEAFRLRQMRGLVASRLSGKSRELRDGMHRARELADQRDQARRVLTARNKDVAELAPLGSYARGELVRRA